MVAKYTLGLIGLLLCHFVNTRSVENEHTLKGSILQAINDMTPDVLRTYLGNNNEAFARFGGKIESLAEKLLDKQVELIETDLDNILGDTDAPTNNSLPSAAPIPEPVPAPEPLPAAELVSTPAPAQGSVKAEEPVVTLEPVPPLKIGPLPKPEPLEPLTPSSTHTPRAVRVPELEPESSLLDGEPELQPEPEPEPQTYPVPVLRRKRKHRLSTFGRY